VTIRVLEVAQQELDEAIAYYNGQAPGLGDGSPRAPKAQAKQKTCRITQDAE
jgi:hypothetical protein